MDDPTNNERIIDSSRRRFDAALHTPEYRRVHADDEQLGRLIDLFEIEDGKAYLDIGTGNGYGALALARRFSGVSVRGLDIAGGSIARNAELARREGLSRVAFDTYAGRDFPYADGQFAGCVSRYAFHHFPDPDASAAEIARVTAARGFFILSDPVTAPGDGAGFIDRFQALVNDGHVHFSARREIECLLNRHGFFVEREFDSSVRSPRELNPACKRLLDATDRETLDLYAIERIEDKAYVTVKVMNVFFRKKSV